MAVYVTATFPAKPGKGKELQDFLEGMLTMPREQPGHIEIVSTRNLDKPDEVVLFEKWNARADHEAYLAKRKAMVPPDAFVALLAGEFSISYYE